MIRAHEASSPSLGLASPGAPNREALGGTASLGLITRKSAALWTK